MGPDGSIKYTAGGGLHHHRDENYIFSEKKSISPTHCIYTRVISAWRKNVNYLIESFIILLRAKISAKNDKRKTLIVAREVVPTMSGIINIMTSYLE